MAVGEPGHRTRNLEAWNRIPGGAAPWGIETDINIDFDIEKDKDKEITMKNATIHVMIDITVTWELWTQDSIHNSYDVSFDISHFGGDLKHL